MQDLPKRDAVVDVYILVARSTDIGAHIAARGRILFVQVHCLTALRAARRIYHGRFSIAANSRSIFSASARSAGCSLANPPPARTFSNILGFSAAEPCTSRTKVSAMLLRFGSLCFRNMLPLPSRVRQLYDCFPYTLLTGIASKSTSSRHRTLTPQTSGEVRGRLKGR